MALTEYQQIKKLLDDSRYILIVFAPSDQGDALASSLALKHLLDKQRKQVDIVSTGFTVPKNFKFLPLVDTVKKELSHLQKFIVKVDVSKAPIDTLSYDIKDNWLSIYLTPKQGIITKHELRTAQSTFKYDLIITLGTPDLTALGDIFSNNTDLFYRVPIINIDHQPSNERYGQLNLVDLTTTSSAEIVFSLIKHIEPTGLNQNVATALLTGMIVATKSFKNEHLSPHTLQLASELVEHGADREKIVQHLYRTRSIAALKLWGQALTHLETDSKHGLVWTTLTRDDFSRSGAATEDLHGIVDELISNSPEAKIVAVLYEEMDDTGKMIIKGIVTTDKNFDALALTKPLSSEGNKKQATFSLHGQGLKDALEKTLETIRQTTGLR